MNNVRSKNSGAALVVAIAVLTVLLLIGITFFRVSRLEVKTASNVENAMRAEMYADGAIAIAIGMLNADRAQHPDYTSADHAWATYWNGTWIAGKGWAFDELAANPTQGSWGSNRYAVPYIRFDEIIAAHPEIQFHKRSDLFVPRWQGNDISDVRDFSLGFVLANESAFTANNYPVKQYAEQINAWADVDSDGDGLKDAMWIPMPIELAFDDDGLDNDLDGRIDQGNGLANGMDDDGDGEIDEADEEYPSESAVFLYRDDDGNIKFTVPLLGMRFYLDLNEDGEPDDYNRDGTFDLNDTFQLPTSIRVASYEGLLTITYDPANPDYYDETDNDFSMMINDFDCVAYRADRNNDIRPPRDYYEINSFCFGGALQINDPDNTGETIDLQIRCTGEPVCEIGGRVAVLVRDAASKPNVNVINAYSFDEQFDSTATLSPDSSGNTPPVNAGTDGDHPLVRARNQALGPQEYDSRVIPHTTTASLGRNLANRFSAFRYGAWNGEGFASNEWNDNSGATPPLLEPPDAALDTTTVERYFGFDISLPGLGRVDDNGNAFWLAMNRLDDDGDGLIDEGLNTGAVITDADRRAWPSLTDQQITDKYQAYLGCLEGIDEPLEYDTFRLASNPLAEADGRDNNENDIIDEPGEMADARYRTTDQLEEAAPSTVGEQTLVNLQVATTVQSVEKGLPQNVNYGESLPKVDYNYATAKQIAQMLINEGGYTKTALPTPASWGGTSEAWTVLEAFAQGLRLGDVSLVIPEDFAGGIFSGSVYGQATSETQDIAIPADGHLRAMQLAANIVDNRDANHTRSVLSNTTFESDDNSIDPWWEGLSGGEERTIEYKVAGVESIRINEIMVRPVRRVEAETYFTAPDDDTNYFNPNLFSYVLEHDGTEVMVPDFGPRPSPGYDTVDMPLGLTIAPGDTSYFGYPNIIDYGLLNTYTGLGLVDADFEGGWGVRGEYLGEKAARTTGAGSFWVNLDPDNSLAGQAFAVAEVPNVVQFRFTASPKLPPGRYYLTVNTSSLGASNTTTVDAAAQLSYAIKYVGPVPGIGVGMTDILDDIAGLYPPNPGDITEFMTNIADYQGFFVHGFAPSVSAYLLAYWNDLPAEYIGVDAANLPTGWAFLADTLDDNTIDDPNLLAGYHAGATGINAVSVEARKACPVIVPAPCYDDDGDGFLDENFHPAAIPEPDYPGNPWGLPQNERDDDGDGYYDEAPDTPAGSSEPWPPDGIDNDNDGWIDDCVLPIMYPEPDCIGNPYGLPPNGLDDDGDGVVDDSPYDPQGRPEYGPINGADDDGDGFIDDCHPAAAPELDYEGNPYALVPNGIDDDGDGFIDDGPLHPAGRAEPAELVVALRMNPAFVGAGNDGFDNDGDGFVDYLNDPADEFSMALNFFDFSQEPDHEWVELVNIDKGTEPIDLSGWHIQVGYGKDDPKAITLKLPDATFIAPGGSILVGANKFDDFMAVDPVHATSDQLLYHNGIGLAAGEAMLDYAGVTCPPNYPVSYFYELPNDSYTGACPYESIFRRNDAYDFIDNDGNGFMDDDNDDASGDDLEQDMDSDGRPDGDSDDANDTLDTWEAERLLSADFRVMSTPCTINEPDDGNKAWDRIVEAEVIAAGDRALIPDVGSAAEVAQWVLGGGIFPNYPERDAVDNDGDSGQLGLWGDGVDNNGNQVIYGNDGLDNDNDGEIDEADEGLDEVYSADGVDNDLDGVIDNEEEKWFGYFDEGIDEGRFRIEFAGRWLNSYDGSNRYMAPAGSFSPYFADELLLNFAYPAVGDPPEWAEFVERRFFPGDNVIITLYQGPVDEDNVVDRVTYCERDVLNRAADDVIECPFVYTDTQTGNILPATLNPDLLTFWPDNTMGLDFYRSLERKHPLYSGDRFGTKNRWEATDGNYDDWAPSLSPWAHPIRNFGDGRYVRYSSDDLELRYQFEVAPPLSTQSAGFVHAFDGSPLRMNFTQRLLENPLVLPNNRTEYPKDATFAPRQLYARDDRLNGGSHYQPQNPISNPDFVLPVDFCAYIRNVRWAFERAGVDNRPYASVADVLLTIDWQDTVRYDSLYDEFGGLWSVNVNDAYAVNGVQGAPALACSEDLSVAKVLAGQRERVERDTAGDAINYGAGYTLPDEATALVGPGAGSNPIILTCAQADFTSLLPVQGEHSGGWDEDDVEDAIRWPYEDHVDYFPEAWTPVFLVQNPSDVADDDDCRYRYRTFSPSTADFWPSPAMTLEPSEIPLTERFYFLASNGFFNNTPALPDSLSTDDWKYFNERWPIEERRMMYVSMIGDTLNTSFPEALFEWGPEDGLQAGTYDVYIVTCEDIDPHGAIRRTMELAAADPTLEPWQVSPYPAPQLVGETDINGDIVAPFLLKFQEPRTSTSVNLSDMALDVRFFNDPDDITNFEPAANQDVEANPMPPDPPEWASPNQEGIIYYEAGPVKVTNSRYLALRIRNAAPAGYLNRFSRIILTPRARTAGRININTVETRGPVDRSDADAPILQLYNPLMGVPGILAYRLEESGSDYLGDFSYPPIDDNIALLEPEESDDQRPENIGDDADPPAADTIDARKAALYTRMRRITQNRPEHDDGRYYENLAQLLNYRNGANRSFEGILAPTPSVTGLTDESWAFDEAVWRLAHMTNLVSTRSDVFEIIVTAQAGTGFDANNDGVIDWRDPQEFIPSAEKSAQSVYERPEPKRLD